MTSRWIHFDNCGAAIMPQSVQKTIADHYRLEAIYGGYVAQEKASDQIEAVYRRLAQLFGGRASDYALLSGAAEAWSRLFYSFPLDAGDVVVTAYNEYCSNYIAYRQRVERDGIDVRVVPSKADGSVDLAAFEAAISQADVKLVSLSGVPSSSGQILPLEQIGQWCRAAGKPFLLDACQTFGHVPVDLEKIGCDMATGTSRKFLRGPRGVGFLYVSPSMRGRLDPVMRTNNSGTWVAQDRFDMRDDARLFETWERNIAAVLGFGAALQVLLDGPPDAVYAQLARQASRLRERLYAVDGVVPACPPDATGAIITINISGYDAGSVKALLAEQGIGVQVASVVHTRLDLERRGIDSAVRVSPHVHNTEADEDALVSAVAELSADRPSAAGTNG